MLVALSVMAVGCPAANSLDPASGDRAVAAPAPSASDAGIACPSRDFAGFLREFAATPDIQRAHMAPVIDVVDWIDANEPQLGTEVLRIPREQYNDFKLVYRNGGYHHVEDAVEPDPIPVTPRVTATDDGYRVEYIFNMSEGNSWNFRSTRGCWQLVGEPDPSLL